MLIEFIGAFKTMARKKGNNNKKMVSFYCDPNEWQELPNNINCSCSEFLRQCISKQINKSDKITELRKLLLEKENEKKIIDLEIKDIKESILNLENEQLQNENNQLLIYNKMDIIKKVAQNENGITEKRIITIANDEIKPFILIREAKKQGIKIIDKDKQTNSRIINKVESKPETKENNLLLLVKILNRNFKRQEKQFNNDKLKFLEHDKEHYKTMCGKKGINYNDLKNYVIQEKKRNEKE